MTALDYFLKTFLEPFSYLIYAVVLLIKSHSDKTVEKKVLFFYYMCATLLLLIASILVIYTERDIDNNWLYNIFYLITISVLSYYFYRLFNNKVKRYIVIFLLALNLILFVTYDIILGRFFYAFNGYIFAICNLSVVVYTLLYFDQLLRNVNENNILYEFDFWLISGYLFNFLGCFCIILYYENTPPGERGSIWSLQNVILFVSSLVTLAGYLWIDSRKKV